MMAIHFDEVWNDEECNQMCDVCRHGNGKSLSHSSFCQSGELLNGVILFMYFFQTTSQWTSLNMLKMLLRL